MKRCQIKYISPKAFALIPNIHTVDLSFNNLTISALRQGLKGFNGSSIEHLDISNIISSKKPQTLPRHLFRSLQNTKLTSLKIRSWNLNEVNGNIFQNLSCLHTLDLSMNKIYSFKMKGLSKIRLLNLTWNKMIYLPEMCNNQNRSLVPKLNKLYLAINHLLDSQDFQKQGHCLPNLFYLNLSFNLLDRIKSNSFSTLKKLGILRIGNMLTYDLVIEEDALNSKTLKMLFLGSYKRVSKDTFNPKTLFKKCRQLTRLEMSKFDFSDFSIENFRVMISPLKNLKELILRQNNVNNVPDTSNFPNLTFLDLEGNMIRQVHKDFFQNNTQLRSISLKRNQLTTIRQDTFTDEMWRDPNLSIDISYNPFACDCDLEWFIIWANKKGIISKNSDYQCYSPEEWKTTRLDIHIQSLKTSCHPVNRVFITVLTIFSFMFIFLFGLILAWKLRWDIKYYLHTCRWKDERRSRYQKIIDNELIEYDGFVAYNTRDRKWIMSELVDVIEQKEHYKLCLHERNFLPSCAHVDNILESIEASRKFILVLSNNFMSDQWCNYEAIIANHKLADGNGDRIFLILLGKINSKHFTTALKTLLKAVENAEWTLNENGKKLFWKKLKRFMEK
ncbi:toll-like receptor 7 [Saccostrea cucullata]|uniref:toll-like receptor 7 n=1 Tax=Saccostrea cuccullata TaxID=36930 RepID=UPI002ED0926F